MNALHKVKDEKGMKRVEKFLREDTCPECGGSRYVKAAYGIRYKNKGGGDTEPVGRRVRRQSRCLRDGREGERK